MIIRIVKMSFHADRVDDFTGVFNEMQDQIKQMPGCNGLSLLRDTHNECQFFTYSIWDSEAALDAYRQSEFFQNLWSKAKQGFNAKPEAWSLDDIS